MTTSKTAAALAKIVEELEINRKVHQRTLDQCAARRKRYAVAAAQGNSEARQELDGATAAETTAKAELATIDLALETTRDEHRAAVKHEKDEAEARRLDQNRAAGRQKADQLLALDAGIDENFAHIASALQMRRELALDLFKLGALTTRQRDYLVRPETLEYAAGTHLAKWELGRNPGDGLSLQDRDRNAIYPKPKKSAPVKRQTVDEFVEALQKSTPGLNAAELRKALVSDVQRGVRTDLTL